MILSNCGMFSDSPASTDAVRAESEQFRVILRRHCIRSHLRYTQSGNLFMAKRWVAIHSRDFARALRLAKAFLKVDDRETRWIHDAARGPCPR